MPLAPREVARCFYCAPKEAKAIKNDRTLSKVAKEEKMLQLYRKILKQ